MPQLFEKPRILQVKYWLADVIYQVTNFLLLFNSVENISLLLFSTMFT